MPRKLPWARAENEPSLPPIKTESPRNVKRKSPSSHSTPPRPKRVAQPHSGLLNRTRSPSTSPPPEPPKEQFMVASDDRYRIVEDEFLHTAQKFTAHLHRAEYQRLKALAASQNAETIRAIERPVVGLPNRVVKRSAEVARKKEKQRTVTESTDDPKHPATGLRGLMESPRKEIRSIRTLGKATTGTRAAAGFGSRGSPSRRAEQPTLTQATTSSSRTTGNDAQDRAASPSRRRRQVPTERPPAELEEDSGSNIDTTDDDEDLGSLLGAQRRDTSARHNAQTISLRATSSASSSSKRIARTKSAPDLKQRTQPGPDQTQTEIVRVKDDDEDDDDDPFGIKKMRVRRAKSRDQMRKPAAKDSVDLIPSFL